MAEVTEPPGEIGHRLKAHWRSHGLRIASGCTNEALTHFESKYMVTLPIPIRAYYLTVNGMLQSGFDSVDQNGFAFWPLENVVDSHFVLSKYKLPTFEGDRSFFVFADYREWSWAYAFELGVDSRNRVILVGRDEPQLISNAFPGFVDQYIDDSSRLLQGNPLCGLEP